MRREGGGETVDAGGGDVEGGEFGAGGLGLVGVASPVLVLAALRAALVLLAAGLDAEAETHDGDEEEEDWGKEGVSGGFGGGKGDDGERSGLILWEGCPDIISGQDMAKELSRL